MLLTYLTDIYILNKFLAASIANFIIESASLADTCFKVSPIRVILLLIASLARSGLTFENLVCSSYYLYT